jgi:hypothetical protein
MIHNIFISHSWAYSNSYERLLDLLDSHPRFLYRNYSVPIYDPVHTSGSDKKLENAVYSKMYNCHAIIVLAGVYSSYSKWINIEMEIAKHSFRNPKPIIGVIPRGQINISKNVQEKVDDLVGWKSDSIVNSIRWHR